MRLESYGNVGFSMRERLHRRHRRRHRRRHPEGCGYTNEVRLRGLKNQRFKSLRRQALFV